MRFLTRPPRPDQRTTLSGGSTCGERRSPRRRRLTRWKAQDSRAPSKADDPRPHQPTTLEPEAGRLKCAASRLSRGAAKPKPNGTLVGCGDNAVVCADQVPGSQDLLGWAWRPPRQQHGSRHKGVRIMCTEGNQGSELCLACQRGVTTVRPAAQPALQKVQPEPSAIDLKYGS